MLHFGFPNPQLMGHRLSKIYTRTGDSGETGLGDGSRARKDSPRVVALGEIDELNSAVGVGKSRRPGAGLPEPAIGPAFRSRPRPQPRGRPWRRVVAAGQEPLAHASTKASSRFLRTVGATTTASRRPAMRSMVRLIGRWKNTSGSPRDKSIARRRFSSIKGPRMKPRIRGAGSHSSFTKM